MLIIGFFLAGLIALLGFVVVFAIARPARPVHSVTACCVGAAIGLPVGLYMGGVNPPQYDWFGFYPLGQIVASTLGGLAGGAVAAALGRLPALKAHVEPGMAPSGGATTWASPVGQPVQAERRRIGAGIVFAVVALGVIIAGMGAYRYVNPTRVPAVALPEVRDAVVYPLRLVEGMTMEEVRAAAGEPTLTARDEDYSSWYYGVRNDAWGREGSVLAPLLQITVDAADRVQSWQFVHPTSGQPLEQREGELEATRWLNARCGSGDGPRVVLAERLIPGVTSSEEVLAAFGSWSMQPWTFEHRREIFARPLPGGGQVLSYPVDHPSAMYLPVMYIEVSFDDAGRMQVWSFAGGC